MGCPIEQSLTAYYQREERAQATADRIDTRLAERLDDLAWLDEASCDWLAASITVPLDLAAGTILRRARLREGEQHAYTSVTVSAALIALAMLPAGDARDYVAAELRALIEQRTEQAVRDEIAHEPEDESEDEREAA